jgi:hypothetical protein
MFTLFWVLQRSTFVRVIDVEKTDDERTITNDRTSLLMRSLKKNWDLLNAQPQVKNLDCLLEKIIV